MPIYEYKCEQCDHYLEAIQKISDAPLADCPECGGQGKLKKLVSAAGFRLKGTGWYETDFKHRGRKPAEKAGEGKPEDKKVSPGSDAGTAPAKAADTAAKS